ncbi:MAG: phage tail protein [Actinomycetota bacterium]
MALEWTVTNSHFGLKIDGITGSGDLGRFQKVSGLGVKMETEPVTEGGQNQYVHQLPGRLKWNDLEFERGVVSTDKLFDWLMASSGDGFGSAGNHVVRHTGTITMYSADGKPLRKWNFSGGMPVGWTGPSFDADGDTIITEKLTLAHDGLVPA